MKIKTAVISALVAVGAASVITAPSASAIPGNCYETGRNTGSYLVGCHGGNGQFQAWANCRNGLWPHDHKMVTGPWASPGRTSTAVCYGPPFTSFKVVYGGRSLR